MTFISHSTNCTNQETNLQTLAKRDKAYAKPIPLRKSCSGVSANSKLAEANPMALHVGWCVVCGGGFNDNGSQVQLSLKS